MLNSSNQNTAMLTSNWRKFKKCSFCCYNKNSILMLVLYSFVKYDNILMYSYSKCRTMVFMCALNVRTIFTRFLYGKKTHKTPNKLSFSLPYAFPFSNVVFVLFSHDYYLFFFLPHFASFQQIKFFSVLDSTLVWFLHMAPSEWRCV